MKQPSSTVPQMEELVSNPTFVHIRIVTLFYRQFSPLLTNVVRKKSTVGFEKTSH